MTISECAKITVILPVKRENIMPDNVCVQILEFILLKIMPVTEFTFANGICDKYILFRKYERHNLSLKDH
jgi:hypothetical protein